MTGELFEIKNNCLKVVSLDGHRISIRKMSLKKDYSDRKVVVPGKTLSEVSKILSGEVDDQVSIYFTKNHILFEFDQTIVVSRLIEGEYFRIDQMLSSDYETKVTINKKEFLEKLETIIPWETFFELIQPSCYKGELGNKPYPLELMLRIFILQNVYNLADMAVMNEVIDSRAFSNFCGINSPSEVPNGDTRSLVR